MALKTSQLAVKMALRGAKMAISGVLKYARAYAQDTGFFDFVARRLCLKLLAAKSIKTKTHGCRKWLKLDLRRTHDGSRRPQDGPR